MKTIILCAAALVLPAVAPAQLRLYVVDGGTEQAAPAVLDMGTVHAGNTQESRFLVRNEGVAKANVDKLFVAGAGFALTHYPTIPYILASGASVEFRVRFAPQSFGSYSASLTVNTTSVLLVGRTASSLTVLGEGGAALGTSTPFDFGETVTGSEEVRTFSVRNDTGGAVVLPDVSVSGDSFRGPEGLQPNSNLSSGASATFRIRFVPETARKHEGWLVVGDRGFPLAGTGTAAPFPKPTLILENPAISCGGRTKVQIRLGVASPSSGQGTLELALEPAAASAVDEAVQFMAGGRSVPFTVKEGETTATVDSEFQAGTTAGTLVLTARIGVWSESLRVPLNPQTVTLDSASASRSSSQLEVNLKAFDNTRSLSKLAFTFYLRDGSALPQGAISVNVQDAFGAYFQTSTLGGSFSMKLAFPVNGDASVIAGVEVEATNSAGNARTQRLTF